MPAATYLKRMRKHRFTIFITALIVLIVGAHLALWASDAPYDAKLRLTLLNGTVWAVIILPAIGVRMWLITKTRKDRR